jgi:hypothetical protein
MLRYILQALVRSNKSATHAEKLSITYALTEAYLNSRRDVECISLLSMYQNVILDSDDLRAEDFERSLRLKFGDLRDEDLSSRILKTLYHPARL